MKNKYLTFFCIMAFTSKKLRFLKKDNSEIWPWVQIICVFIRNILYLWLKSHRKKFAKRVLKLSNHHVKSQVGSHLPLPTQNGMKNTRESHKDTHCNFIDIDSDKILTLVFWGYPCFRDISLSVWLRGCFIMLWKEPQFLILFNFIRS